MGSAGKARGLVTLLALLGVVGVAGAQQAASPNNAKAPAPVELGGGRDVSLTIEQMSADAKGALPEMDRGAAVVRRQLAEAREKRDVVRVLCLNDKLDKGK